VGGGGAGGVAGAKAPWPLRKGNEQHPKNPQTNVLLGVGGATTALREAGDGLLTKIVGATTTGFGHKTENHINGFLW
jgi:hypothetical protein